MTNTLIRIEGLRKHYTVADQLVRALDGIDISLPEGKTVAVVGESGSGKTTLGNLILGIEEPTEGQIWFRDQYLGKRRSKDLRRKIQVVQQNPYTALNPRRPVRHAIELPLIVHNIGVRAERHERIADMLQTVELGPDFMTRFPGSLSGGQRQRVALARALTANPEIVILDEPTSALDVSVQAKVLALLLDLQQRLQLTYMFITHDLSTVRNIADSVVVLYRGKVVEKGPTDVVFSQPRHRYTTMLLSSIPVISLEDEALKPEWPWERTALDEGNHESAGCGFAPRCPFADDVCWRDVPVLVNGGDDGHAFACHHPLSVLS